METSTLTSEEQIGLKVEYGFADGHAYHDLSASQKRIITELPDHWEQAADGKHHDIEGDFVDRFFTAGRQFSKVGDGRYVIATSASQSIDLVGRWASKNSIRVTMIEPVFDNLALLLKRWSVLTGSILEDRLRYYNTDALVPDTFDALFLVLPNNPTGFMMPEEEFRELASWCGKQGKALIIDACFRFYVKGYYDIFAILESEGVTYLVIEDTGKTWPILDMKASILSASSDIIDEIRGLYYEIFLCVSPFSLRVITDFVQQSIYDGLDDTLRALVGERRGLFRHSIENSPLVIPEQQKQNCLPLEWVRIPDDWSSDADFVAWLRSHRIACLPGRYFYWLADGPETKRFIRFSFLKPERVVYEGFEHLKKVLLERYQGQSNGCV